eukprot:TRINITY_DN7454_c0_g2_i3.p1 TRINITY_DN7454_c0_g2~~TRINITY_DN7454_c0_g2_i3.p1  ORF type:complete len:223 (-),score=47.56 TRINITY_DN7454_c0_g2_i3:392-1060(-)
MRRIKTVGREKKSAPALVHNATPTPSPSLVDDHDAASVPNTPLKESLLTDGQFSEKDIYDGDERVFQIVRRLRAVLHHRAAEHKVRISIPNSPEFYGLTTKYFRATSGMAVGHLLYHCCSKSQAVPGSYMLVTRSGIELQNQYSLESYGLGTVLSDWELTLCRRPDGSTNNNGLPGSPMASSSTTATPSNFAPFALNPSSSPSLSPASSAPSSPSNVLPEPQ